MSATWLEKSLNYLDNCDYNKERSFGNHGVVKERDSDGIVELVFKYFGSDIVRINSSKGIMTVSDFGFSRGYTPRSIHEIMRHYADQDYEVQTGAWSGKSYDYWYNDAVKYSVKIFDIDFPNFCENWLSWSFLNGSNTPPKIPDPVISTIVDIDTESKKEFRDNYVNRMCEHNHLRFLGKAVCICDEHRGIGYRYTPRNYLWCGTILFQPVIKRLTRSRYLSIK